MLPQIFLIKSNVWDMCISYDINANSISLLLKGIPDCSGIVQNQTTAIDLRVSGTFSLKAEKKWIESFFYFIFFLWSVKYFEISSMKTECKIMRTHSTLLCLLFITWKFLLKFFIAGYLKVSSLLDFQKYEAVGLIYITGQQMESGKPTGKVPNSSSVINIGIR